MYSSILFVYDRVVVMLEMSMFYEGDRRVPGQCSDRRGQASRVGSIFIEEVERK